jgi:hypothetical protein
MALPFEHVDSNKGDRESCNTLNLCTKSTENGKSGDCIWAGGIAGVAKAECCSIDGIIGMMAENLLRHRCVSDGFGAE